MTIVNSDEMFENWKTIMGEIRRISLGKYNGPGNDFNLTEQIPIYSGPDKCHHKFNFLLEGNRCPSCNTLSYLSTSGQFTNTPLLIQHGDHTGKVISVQESPKHDKCETNFGHYTRKHFNFDVLRQKLPPIGNMYSILDSAEEYIFMANVDSQDSHYIVISSLAEASAICSGRFLTCHICNTKKIVKRTPEHIGSFKSIILSPKEALSILTKCILTTIEDIFVQGGPDIRHLSFDRVLRRITFGSNSLNTECDVFIEPTDAASISLEGYENTKIKFIGKDSFFTREEDLGFIPADIKIAKDKDLLQLVNIKVYNPSVKSHADNSIVVLRPTRNLFDFVEKTGILIFPPLYLYMWFIVLLCEKSFYDAFAEKHSTVIRAFFFADERESILVAVRKWHQKESPTYLQCKDMVISLGFAMRFDAIARFQKTISGEFKK